MRKKKNVMFYITLAVALALPMGMTAQERALFSTSPASETSGSRSLLNQNQNRGNQLSSDGLGNQGFNQDPVPVGSGVIMLIAAGAGYALLKKKNNK